MTEIAKPLTVAEADYLAECEERIRSGLQTFVEVGTALAMIRDNKLYRATHRTFADYCEARWQIGRAHAYRMIDAAQAVSPIGDTELPMPRNEAQARELARLPEGERVEVWARAHEATDGKPTAAAIREAANPSRPAPPPVEADAQLDAPAPHGVREADTGTGTPVEAGDGAGVFTGAPAPQTAVEERGRDASTDAPGEEVPFPSVRAGAAGAPTGTAGAPVIPSAVQAALDKYVPDPNPHREWQQRYFEAIAGVHKVIRFTPEDVAEKADDELVDELGRVADALADYRLRVAKAYAANLPENVTPLRRTS